MYSLNTAYPNRLFKRVSHLGGGHKETTANQLKQTLSLFGGDRFAGRIGCYTHCHSGQREASLWDRSILWVRKGSRCSFLGTKYCYADFSIFDKRGLIYCCKVFLKVPRDCHRAEDQKGCGCCVSHHSFWNDSGNCDCHQRKYSETICVILDGDCFIRVTLYHWHNVHVSIHLPWNTATKKRPQTGQLSPQEAKELKKDVNNNATVTLSLILGTLVLTYLPAITVASIQAFTNFFESGTKMTLISWTDCATVFNSLSNPIIYCWRNQNLRKALLEIIHRAKQENTPSVSKI